jgi:uncharacterized metal-binding protein YceD (DUF177 family)
MKFHETKRGTVDPLCFCIEQCRDGEEILFDEVLEPGFLNLEEDPELSADAPVRVHGKVYRALDWMILNAEVDTSLRVFCSMCNEPFPLACHLKQFVHEQQVSEIKDGTWDVKEALREAILLEVPYFALCGGKNCIHEAEIRPFLRSNELEEEEGQKPFKDLSFLTE